MSRYSRLFIAVASLGLATQAAGPLQAQIRENHTVNQATAVLDEVMNIPARGVPRSLLEKAHGVVIIPGWVKGGFIVGVRHGRGVALIRDEGGFWGPPRFVEMTGGSVGFQAGVQSTDIVLVFMTHKSIGGLLRGTFTIGADAAAAAGPVGRNVAAATDGRLKAEILSYSRSRGLFAGVSLDGSSIELDGGAEHAFYGMSWTAQPTEIPESALRLIQRLSEYSGSPTFQETAPRVAEIPDKATVSLEEARRQLAEASARLANRLPEDWQRYLALPAEVYSPDRLPTVESLERPLRRFERIATDRKYRSLASRSEFQTTHEWLRQYVSRLTTEPSRELRLPSPPSP